VREEASVRKEGIVLSETVVHSAPARFAAEAPYQIALVEVKGERKLVQVKGERAQIGDVVQQNDGDFFEVKK
jgi:uncharacterized OB-fold protein